MNGKDIILSMQYVGDDLIERAEYGQFPTQAGSAAKKRLSFRRPLLIAAIIALTLLLVGCAVVYVLRMQNFKVGEETVTEPVLAGDGIHITGFREVNCQLLTPAALEGTPGYQAAKEWLAFTQEYGIPEGEVPDFPAEYDAYNLRSQEMKDKLDELLVQYDLKPMGASLAFRTVKNMCAALGVDRIQTAQNQITVAVERGRCWENGNFSLTLDFTLPKDPDTEVHGTMGSLEWSRKDCFSESLISIADTGDWKEWNYTTASGSEVLIIRSPSDWRGWILCDRGEALLSLRVETRQDLYNNVDGKSWTDQLFLTDRQMEQIADAVDFGIRPRRVSQQDVDNQPPMSDSMTQDGYTVTLKSVETDGWIAKIVLGITAPEGTVISHNPVEGALDAAYYIGSVNLDSFTPAVGSIGGGSGGWNAEEDHDGLDNTQNLVLIKQAVMQDGSDPFAAGTQWTVRLEDLRGSYRDREGQIVEKIFAEGEWVFDISFDETNGDYREIQFLDQPITVKAAAGMYPDGSDAEEEVEITSLKLRKFGVAYDHNAEYADLTFMNGKGMYVVMKDGRRIRLWGWNKSGEAETPIDLERVDHILLPDGTLLPAPETEE